MDHIIVIQYSLLTPIAIMQLHINRLCGICRLSWQTNVNNISPVVCSQFYSILCNFNNIRRRVVSGGFDFLHKLHGSDFSKSKICLGRDYVAYCNTFQLNLSSMSPLLPIMKIMIQLKFIV